MSVKDLITKWEQALAEAHVEASRLQELANEDLESAAFPGIGTRSRLRAGCGPALTCGTGEQAVLTC